MSELYRIGDNTDYLLWRRGSGEHTVEIYDIAVGSQRRQGIGRSMLQRLYKEIPRGIKTVFAITRADNRIAQLFYEEMRFRIGGNLFDFYKDNECLHGTVDAVMYCRDIGSSA